MYEPGGILAFERVRWLRNLRWWKMRFPIQKGRLEAVTAERDGYKANSNHHKILYLGAKDLHEKAEARLKTARELLSMLEYQHRESQDCGGEAGHGEQPQSICFVTFCDTHIVTVRKWLEEKDA